MIKKLKKKFIISTMISLFILLSGIVAGMNIISYNSLIQEADSLLSVLSTNKGHFPELNSESNSELDPGQNPNLDPGQNPAPNSERPHPMPDHFSMETPYESRYFTVVYTQDGNVVQVDTKKIASVDADEAIKFSGSVIENGDDKGFLDIYRYSKVKDGELMRITFLDCANKLSSFKVFLTASIGMSLSGLLLVFIFISYYAGKIIRPIAESYDKQKRFITDAGHEMRTPLTIINANADILEMEIGENESLDDIKQQTLRLSNLTKNLVDLSRMEESETKEKMITFPVSDVINESIAPFAPILESQKKELVVNITPMLSMKGNAEKIGQLTSILMDNAIKYSPENSKIFVNLEKDAKTIKISVKNSTIEPLDNSQLKNVFDRFYRMDSSRNSEKGGNGIGLSIAKAIVDYHGGKISAVSSDANSFTVIALIPS